MMKRILTLALAAALMLGVCVPAALADGDTCYVFTDNETGLLLRESPSGEVIAFVEEGTQLQVESYVDDNWAMVLWHYDKPGYGVGDWPAYVNRRNLADVEPSVIRAAMEEERNAYTGDPLADITEEFKNAKDVEDYRITMRPARVTSWVNMRWIPSETGGIIGKYKAGEELVVLKELRYYLQVQDPDTGDVGYIHKRFATRLGVK